ncbi:efflux RND transporter periplasmic adaptor subunit [Candidatus Igneacidithiobacillus taiwanensis]|uniref:efflux RND transporter periplasmic adaptor subunit n=1 Tax=Candidatus Igneacidithiobacillus taiwanensis TaxID=1945924 RepID=UPI00289B9320|nr:efflux RND transporter periplasmic adaptor subunit [Candidatus Igneacidithiobacillus taiwanensis]MCE5360293.1 efflux RND transporter periplasmic adaptor subunit [Acidithiobacillus sp.]
MTEVPVETLQASNRSRRKYLLVGLVLALLLMGWAVWWVLIGSQRICTNDAYVEGNITPVQAQSAGTIRHVYVESTEYVRAGTILASLQGDRSLLALRASEAALGRTVRQLRREFAAVHEIQGKLRAQQAQLGKLRDDLQRYRGAAGSGAVAAIQIANTGQDMAALQAEMAATQAKLQAAQALVGGTTLQNNPQVRAAVAELERRYIDWARRDLRAPVSGFVAQRSAYPGLMVHPGERLFTIVPLDDLWVVANVKETEMAQLRPGQPVRLESYYYGSRVLYHGVVQGLVPGAGSAFAVLPPENATGNYIHIVERVPIRIALLPAELRRHPLRPGLSMIAQIAIHDAKGAKTVLQPITQTPTRGYRTQIYAGELAQARHLARAIIAKNA